MSDTSKVNELSYTESITIDSFKADLRLVFAGELYTIHNVISRESFHRCQIDLREYLRNKCLYELYKHAPESSHRFIQEQAKILFP